MLLLGMEEIVITLPPNIPLSTLADGTTTTTTLMTNGYHNEARNHLKCSLCAPKRRVCSTHYTATSTAVGCTPKILSAPALTKEETPLNNTTTITTPFFSSSRTPTFSRKGAVYKTILERVQASPPP